MKKIFFAILFLTISANAQSGYEIKLDLKNYTDTIAYLTFYQFDKTYISDTCKQIKKGKIIFKGKKTLDTGIYSLVSQNKSLLFDFFIDINTQHIELTGDFNSNSISNLKSTSSKLENDFFEYVKFITSSNSNYAAETAQIKGLSKKDSLKIVTEKQKNLNKMISDYEIDFINKNKGTYISEVVNLKTNKTLKEVPLASNGRPDSIAVFNYYKKHYWDGVDFKNDGMGRNPFLHNKLNFYYDELVVKNLDSIIVSIDKMINQTNHGSLMNKLFISYFTSKYENPKIMGYDKIFVHMAEQYFKTGKADGLYNDENINKNIINRAALIKPLLIGNIAPDLTMIAAENFEKINKMGFEKASTSEEMTKIYYDNLTEINSLFLTLHSIKAEYLILVFWDVDCGHCQKEIPILLNNYHELLKDKKDVKVYSVYTKQDTEKYEKYIAENKLDWINVYDGAHTTNFNEKYDIYSTPVIYLLDKDKKIVAKRIGVDQVKDLINEMAKAKEK